MTFEEEMKKLETIVEKLESGDCSLDDSLKLYEEGLKLSKSLKNKLQDYEKKIEELSSNEHE